MLTVGNTHIQTVTFEYKCGHKIQIDKNYINKQNIESLQKKFETTNCSMCRVLNCNK